MTTLTEETTTEFTLSDAQLIGLTWLESGRDLRIHLLLACGQPATLTCEWAVAVGVDLKYGSKSTGLALSWACQFHKDGEVWNMVFEFPPQGKIELTCNAAHFEYGELA